MSQVSKSREALRAKHETCQAMPHRYGPQDNVGDLT